MKDKKRYHHTFSVRTRFILSLLLALFPLFTTQRVAQGARPIQAGTILELSGTLSPGDDISPKIPLYEPQKDFNYRLEATGAAGGVLTLTVSNGGTPLATGAAETGEVAWGTGALLNGTNEITLANNSSVPVDFTLTLYELPTTDYTWAGSASPTGEQSTMRLTFPQDGLYTFDFTATGGDYEFALDDDYIRKQVGGTTSATLFVEAGTHTLEVRQGEAAVDWSVATSYTGTTYDQLPYTKSGEAADVEALPIGMGSATQANLVITTTGTAGDSLYVQAYDTSGSPVLTAPAQVYAGETFWTSFDLNAGVSALQLTAEGGNAAAVDYELQIVPLPAPSYSWEGEALASGDQSYARVHFPTAGRYTFDFNLAGGRFQFALDEDYLLKSVEAPASVTYYVPAGVHDLHLIQDSTQGASAWTVDVSFTGAGVDPLPYAKSGKMGESFTEEWLPVALDGSGTVNLNVQVGGAPADDVVVELYGPSETTPRQTLDAVLGTEDLWEPVALESGVNRLRLLAVGNSAPITYALRLEEVPVDTLTGWTGRSLNGSSLHSSAMIHFSQAGTYRFSIEATEGFANLVLDGTGGLRTTALDPLTTAYDLDVTAGDHVLHVLPDPSFPATEWTASVAPVTAGPTFFTFNGTLAEGITVAPEYDAPSNVDFNLELTVSGDAVDLTIEDEGGASLWSGTALPGETLWGTETLPAGQNRFVLTNPVGGAAASAEVTLTLHYLPQAPYTWEGDADGSGLNSHVRVDFPQDALYTFDLDVAAGRYQFAVDEDLILKTAESTGSVTYFVPAGVHDLYINQDSALGAEWSVAISAPGAPTDALPYAKTGGLVGGSGNDFTEEWLTVALTEATPINLLVGATDGSATESLAVEVYTDDTITPTLVLPTLYSGEEIWETLDLPAGTSRLHLVADSGNTGDLGYSVSLQPLPAPPYTWEGLSTDAGLDSHARLRFESSGLYTFTFGAASGRFQFRVNDSFIQQTVAGASSVAFYVPAGTHDLHIEPDRTTGAEWSVAVEPTGTPLDTRPYTKSGGALDTTFEEAWLPLNFDAATHVNVELTALGDPADLLTLEVLEGLESSTPLLTLSPVHGGETVWATVALPAGPARLRVASDAANAGVLHYEISLRAVPQPTTSWSGTVYDTGLNSNVTIDFPTDGLYRFEVDATEGFANLVVDGGSTTRLLATSRATAYELYVTAGEHEVEIAQDPAFPVTAWTASVSSAAPGSDFFTFDGNLGEGGSVSPEYPVDGPLDFNFALTTTGDDVLIEIRDAGGAAVWSGTALTGETLWGTGTLTAGKNTFHITNPAGGNAVAADVNLTLYTLPEAGYDWSGTATATGLNPNSHVRVIFPSDALYTFDFGAATGSYQFQLNDDYLRKTVTGSESVTYFVSAGTHDLFVHQSPTAGADWDVSISNPWGTHDTLPYTKDGGALDAATYTEEWLPLHLESATQVNLATTITGTDGDILTITAYDASDSEVESATVHAGETRWLTFDLPAGTNRLHLTTASGNSGALAYDLTVDGLPTAAYDWAGLANAPGGTSRAQVTFPTAGLYTFTLTATTGRFQFRLGENLVQKVVEDSAAIAYYVPAGTHDLYIDQDPVTGADWSVSVGSVDEATDALPYSKTGGELGGSANHFTTDWMPVFLGAPQRVNVELTVTGDVTDSLELDVLSGFQGTTTTLSLGPVYGTETVWATVDLTGMDRLRLRAAGNDDPLSYTVTLHPLPNIDAVWKGVSRGVGIRSQMRLDTPVSGRYRIQMSVPTGFASVNIDPPTTKQMRLAGFYYEFEANLSAGMHTFEIEQDDGFPTTSWMVSVTLTAADAPTLVSIDPVSVTTSAATPITLTGTNFMPDAEVRLEKGTETVDLASSGSGTTLQAEVPAGLTLGLYDVVVENPDAQSATLTDGLEVYQPAPTLVSINPARVTDTLSTTLTLTGSHFLTGAAVRLERPETLTLTLTSTYISATELEAVVPAGLTEGRYDIVVENPDGQSTTLIDGLEVYHPSHEIYLPLVMMTSS